MTKIKQPFVITVTGAESTGKSTLSAALAGRLRCPWRKEAARDYLLHLGRDYEERDLLEIHKLQEKQTEKGLRQKPPFLVLDTDAQVLRVWSEIKFGTCAVPILETLALHPPHLYLLLSTEIPWQPDPLREHPNGEDRRRLWHHYHEAVQESSVPFAVLAGNPETQLEKALRVLKGMGGLSFAKPGAP